MKTNRFKKDKLKRQYVQIEKTNEAVVRTSRCSHNHVLPGIPGVEDNSSLVMAIGGIEVRKCHRNAAQPHLANPTVHVQDHSHIYGNSFVVMGCYQLWRDEDEEKGKQEGEGEEKWINGSETTVSNLDLLHFCIL